MMLSLNDDHWSSLCCRNGSAEFIAAELKALYDDPADVDRFSDLWPYLSSEGTTWSAAYPSAPHILELAKQVEGRARFEYLYALALFRINETSEGQSGSCHPDFRESYEQALREALKLLAQLTTVDFGEETVYFISAMASLKGLPRLAEYMDVIAQNDYRCPECEEPLAG